MFRDSHTRLRRDNGTNRRRGSDIGSAGQRHRQREAAAPAARGSGTRRHGTAATAVIPSPDCANIAGPSPGVAAPFGNPRIHIRNNGIRIRSNGSLPGSGSGLIALINR